MSHPVICSSSRPRGRIGMRAALGLTRLSFAPGQLEAVRRACAAQLTRDRAPKPGLRHCRASRISRVPKSGSPRRTRPAGRALRYQFYRP